VGLPEIVRWSEKRYWGSSLEKSRNTRKRKKEEKSRVLLSELGRGGQAVLYMVKESPRVEGANSKVGEGGENKPLRRERQWYTEHDHSWMRRRLYLYMRPKVCFRG